MTEGTRKQRLAAVNARLGLAVHDIGGREGANSTLFFLTEELSAPGGPERRVITATALINLKVGLLHTSHNGLPASSWGRRRAEAAASATTSVVQPSREDAPTSATPIRAGCCLSSLWKCGISFFLNPIPIFRGSRHR